MSRIAILLALSLVLLLTPGSSSADNGALARQHYDTGSTLMQQEDFVGAAFEFQQATELDPAFMLAHYSLGQAYMAMKRYTEAIATYEKCRDLVMNQSSLSQKELAQQDRLRQDQIKELQMALSELRRAKGEGGQMQHRVAIEQRIRLLEEANMRGADKELRVPAELSLALGSAYFRMGRFPDAEREYRAAIDVDKRLGAAHNNLAVICMKSGRLDEAKSEVKAAEKAGFPVHPQFKKDLEKLLKDAKSKQ